MNETIKRGMVILVDLNPTKGSETDKIRPCVVVTNDVYNARVPIIQVTPITEWNKRKELIISNVTVEPTAHNGLTKKSIIDCLQTRPIDYRQRLVRILGTLDRSTISEIDNALKKVFSLD
jgi:mRNA interferase MazF